MFRKWPLLESRLNAHNNRGRPELAGNGYASSPKAAWRAVASPASNGAEIPGLHCEGRDDGCQVTA
jgi:hypothetical protein